MTKILRLKIFVEGITPKIWRRFLVKDNISFHDLHDVIQLVMGWGDYHLYSFYVNKEEISVPDPDFRNALFNAKKIKLKDKLSLKQKFNYLYDFGDSWEHTLIVEKILDSADSPFVPYCIDGKRSCPPEDCGSVSGYYELIKIRKNKKHPEYKEKITGWLGEDFDFEQFNPKEINKELSRLVKIDGRTRYLAPK